MEKDNLINVFKIANFIDSARWGKDNEAVLIDYESLYLEPDQKILSHWLCYITDRRTDYRSVWDKGGKIFPYFVYSFYEKKNFEFLKPSTNTDDLFGFFYKKDEDKYFFKYGEIEYTPTLIPAEYKSILRTFIILSKHDYSLTTYLRNLLDVIETKFESVKSILEKIKIAFYYLSYFDIGQPTKKCLEELYNSYTKELETDILEKNLSSIINKKNGKLEKHSKRLYCCIRDYLKHHEYKNGFKDILKSLKIKEYIYEMVNGKDVVRYDILKELEIPGDVWNNKPEFRECILKASGISNKYNEEKMKSKNIGFIIRKEFDSLMEKLKENEPPEKLDFKPYPEQFDFSFDFVPRMCDVKKCEMCLFGQLQQKDNESTIVDELCVNNKDKLCPLILTYTGYKFRCVGNIDCGIYNLILHRNP